MSEFDYSLLSKILHHLALSNKSVIELSFDLETAFQKNKSVTNSEPVFVSGLARSGTTIIMRKLYETGKFRCLTYNDMPFVLMPGIWHKIKKSNTSEKIENERAHADGIMVNFDSPEAFEEIFWKCFCGDTYIKKNFIVPHVPSNEIMQKFQLFMKHTIASADNSNKKLRYLSKNNNNILRFPHLLQQMPDATFIIPFRHPLQHANSLLKQHMLFSSLQKSNPFVLKYMNWLGHFEFGLGHKPFIFNQDEWDLLKKLSMFEINYWLQCWKNYYEKILLLNEPNCIYICYEDLETNGLAIFDHLLHRLHIENGSALDPFKVPAFQQIENFDHSLAKACMFVYEALRVKSQADIK
ncbi:MAG: sulfotransferase [Bacteroidota bacterium]|jgi:hypothetical protein|nr:sulfotransferase [Bacteroidota bacterium]